MKALLGYARLAAALGMVALALAGCESMSSLSKKIDYKTTGSTPSLELPPDLTAPAYDDRYTVTTASGLAARDASRPKQSDLLPTTPEAHIARAGTERWLVVKATPEQAWAITRQFWSEMGFVLATEQPTLGVMETDWAENRAEIPQDAVRKYIGKYIDIFSSTYKRDKFRTRIERGTEAGTTEIYVSHRGMEEVPTTKVGNAGGGAAGFQWAVAPANPNLEAEMLARLMMRFTTGTAQNTAAADAAVTTTTAASTDVHARLEKGVDGPKLFVDDPFDRAWRRVGLALDRTGFTVVDRDRSSGLYYVRYADPDADMTRKDREKSWLAKLMFWKTEDKDKPEQYRIKVAEVAPQSVVSVQDTAGNPEKSQAGDKILALLQEQLK
ncbi:MAG TPA: outer membrane protein assembly factor BamC [Casimicrobiaceae bacterium]|nr:outer membrane protein assembly factor BamC [Casimicrobiaceae bacterium]